MNWLKNLLCKLSIHNWKTFQTDRFCENCKKKQGLYAKYIETNSGKTPIVYPEWRDE